MAEELTWRVASVKTLAEARAFRVDELTVRHADGREREKIVLKHYGAVVVLGVLKPEKGSTDPRVLIVRNERHALGERLDELPAGGIDRDEDPAVAAARELREETGYEASAVEPIGRFYTTPGLTDELMHAYIAHGLSFVGQALEEGEELECRAVPLGELLARMDAGDLTDGKTITTLLLALRAGLIG